MPRKKLTATEKHTERMADAKVVDRLERDRRELSLLLGFDSERGGRRYRELVVQSDPRGVGQVIVNLSDATLSMTQAKIVQHVLHLPVALQQIVLNDIIGRLSERAW